MHAGGLGPIPYTACMQSALVIVVICLGVVGVLWGLHKFGGMFPDLATTDSDTVRHAKVLRWGVNGQAVVVSVNATKASVGDDPVMMVKLMVRKEHWQPYEVTLHTTLKPSVLAQLQPGSDIPVKIDPKHPESVAIVL